MGAEVSEVILADRGRYCHDGYYGPFYGGWNGCGNGWGGNCNGGWGAAGGAIVGGGIGAAAVSIWDKVNDTKATVESVKATVKDAEAGIYKDMARTAEGTNARVDGTAKEVLNNRFTTERGLCDLGYKINGDIRDSRDAHAAQFNGVMSRLFEMSSDNAACCCEIKNLLREVKSDIELQAERNFCELKRGQDQLACLIKDTAKDQEIARLNREIKARDSRELNQKLNFLIQREVGGTTGAAAAAAQQ